MNQYFEDWQYRDGDEARKLVLEIQDPDSTESGISDAKDSLAEMGFRVIEVSLLAELDMQYELMISSNQNTFSTVANSDPHRALSFDWLHNYPGGLAKTHIVPLVLKEFKKTSKKIVALKSKVEKR